MLLVNNFHGIELVSSRGTPKFFNKKNLAKFPIYLLSVIIPKDFEPYALFGGSQPIFTNVSSSTIYKSCY